MALIKICPCCQAHNPASEVMCQSCATFLADVAPVESPNKGRDDGEKSDVAGDSSSYRQNNVIDNSEATVIIKNNISFVDESNRVVFTCKDGEIIGRNGSGSEYLANFTTVSRRHCIVRMDSIGWQIEDFNSSNGTFINGVRITSRERLADNDLLQLSQSCSLRVKL